MSIDDHLPGSHTLPATQDEPERRHFMGEQSASRLEGDRFQHLYSWYELLNLLDENSPFEYGFVEHPEAGAADDITLHTRPGSGKASRYVQVKWHVDHRASYSFDHFAAPSPSGGRSLLRKLFESWRKLQQMGPVEIWLVSNWAAAEDLGRYIQGRDNKLISDFFAEPPKGDLKTALARWNHQLGVSPEELRAFCRDLRLRLGFGSMSDLETQVDERMGRYGLRMGPDPRAIALDEVRRWIEEGGATKRITRESLLEFIHARGLLARREDTPSVGLWIHGWVRRAYEQPPTVELDWTRHFDRDTRTVISAEVWNRELRPELRQAQRRLNERPEGALIDFRGKLPLSVMLAVGASFSEAAGYRFRTDQPTHGEILLWRSDARPSSRQLRSIEREGAPRAHDLLVVLSVTGDAKADLERFEAEHPGAFKTVLLLEPESGPGDNALTSDADAVAFAIQAREHIRRVRNQARTGTTHLIPYAPASFCLFLGQRLNALGRIVTYESTVSGGYSPSLTLETG